MSTRVEIEKVDNKVKKGKKKRTERLMEGSTVEMRREKKRK
jgi:hypothetical protein